MTHHNHPQHEALYHYYCEFDAPALLDSFAVGNLTGTPGTVTNFLGVRVPIEVFPQILQALDGQVEGIPDPGNWHADIAEWAAALYAVSQSRQSFRIVELGCGWACWLNIAGVAARQRNLKIDLIGIEGDRNHLTNARATLDENGFTESHFQLIHGVAGPSDGAAIFPDPAAGEAGWGGEAIFNPDKETLAKAEAEPSVQVLTCYPVSKLAGDGEIDLLHIDIQGAEADFIASNLSDMGSCVRRVLIGTHSRAIEGQLATLFLQAGWRMEMDRPAIAPLRQGKPVVDIDGVQMWANPGLCDASSTLKLVQ